MTVVMTVGLVTIHWCFYWTATWSTCFQVVSFVFDKQYMLSFIIADFRLLAALSLALIASCNNIVVI